MWQRPAGWPKGSGVHKSRPFLASLRVGRPAAVPSAVTVSRWDGAPGAPLRDADSDRPLASAPGGVAVGRRSPRRRCAWLLVGRFRGRRSVSPTGDLGAEMDNPGGPARSAWPGPQVQKRAGGRRAQAGRRRARGWRSCHVPQGEPRARASVLPDPALAGGELAQVGLGDCPAGRAPDAAAMC